MGQYILAIDQGTTSSRAILFDLKGRPVKTAQQEFVQIYPKNGWVEHDPEAIWQTTLTVCQQVLAGYSADEVLGIGITNQRETTLVWDKQTGKPIYNAIVWQDRRTAKYTDSLTQQGHEPSVSEKTGLLLDPYFSASKVRWILDNADGAQQRAEQGKLMFGTVDSFLLWRLTGGKKHATDATNASRTLLFNIHQQQWDEDLLHLFNIPRVMLPEVLDCADDFGVCDEKWFDMELPIAGVAGDQQAALFGQACFDPGMVKSTYGTGCFMIVNTGEQPLSSSNKLLTTVGYRIKGKTTYALEGSIFMAGATMQWLRDGVGLVEHPADSAAMAQQTGADQPVYLVPAFTGLGTPYWDPNARGAIFGMTRDTGAEAIVTAGLQSVAYQTRDLIEAMKRDGVARLTGLKVDGGMVVNNWAMQFLADILNVPVERPEVTETTALGVAYLAGLQLGVYQNQEQLSELWARDHQFVTRMPPEVAERLYNGWMRAVKAVQLFSNG